MRALLASVLHLVVAPVIMCVYGLTPVNHLEVVSSRATLSERLMSLSVGALWTVWAWGVLSVFVGIRRYKATYSAVSGLAAPHVVLALATLLAALGGERSLAKASGNDPIIVAMNDRDLPATSRDAEEVALATLAGVLLHRFFNRQSDLMRTARRGAGYERHSRIAQLGLHRLLELRKSIKANRHQILDASGTPSSTSALVEPHLLPIGFGSEGCVSIPLASRTVINLESSLDVSGITRFIESVMGLMFSAEEQSISITQQQGSTVIQIYMPQMKQGSGSDVGEYRLRSTEEGRAALLEPGGAQLVPFTASLSRQHEFGALAECLKLTPKVVDAETSNSRDHESVDLVIKIMGPLEIICANGDKVLFRKSKSAELLTWLVLHRDRPSREIARTAMWDTNVQDATFNNVVSELRRAVKAVNQSLDFTDSRHQKYIGVPDAIRTDVDIMETAWTRAKIDGSPEAWFQVYESAQAIRGLPFESTNFGWADAEGLTSHIMLKVMNVCGDLAEHFLERGEVDRVFHVTELGLRALPGSEEMLEWRQRALAARSTVKP